jgi:hypothetical protein
LSVVAFLVAVALATIFGMAAAAKLADRPATARGFRALGLPSPYPLAVLVPFIEMGLAGLLVIVPNVGAGAAVVLLALFSALIAGRLAQGLHAPCACFGGSGGPLSWRHLVRNAGLLFAALIVVVGWKGGSPSPVATVAGLVVVAGISAAQWRRLHRLGPASPARKGRS